MSDQFRYVFAGFLMLFVGLLFSSGLWTALKVTGLLVLVAALFKALLDKVEVKDE